MAMSEAPRTSPEQLHSAISRERIKELVLELEYPLRLMLKKLRPDIDKGRYQMIVGEQVSGHLPALILGHAIKLIYRARGLPPPVQGFVAGSRDQRYAASDQKVRLIAPYISQLKENKGEDISWEPPSRNTLVASMGRFLRKPEAKALVVSETISTGVSITPLLRAFRENKIRADVAILYFDNSDEMGIEDLESELGARVIDVEAFPNESDNFFQHKELTGLVKNPEDLFAQRMELTSVQYSNMLEVRRIASEMAHRLVTDFLQEKT